MKKIVLFISLSLLSFNLKGQNTFTLDSAIDYSLNNNRSSKNAASDIEKANAKK